MEGESSGLWNNLPSIIVVEIFSYLSLKDRLNASSVCKAWRNNLFHPKLWRKVVFHLYSCDNKTVNQVNAGASFLAKRCGHFIREATIEVDKPNPTNVHLCAEIFKVLGQNNNLRALSIRPRSSRLIFQENVFLDRFIELLLNIIKRTPNLEHLALGCLEELTDSSDNILHLLANYQASNIRSLHLSSVKEIPGSYYLCDFDSSVFQTFFNLESLSIDYDYMSDELLQILSDPHRPPLRRLCLNMHNFENNVPVISSFAWRKMTAHSPGLHVSLNFLHFRKYPGNFYHIFNQDMPLAHFRVYFSPAFDTEILAHISVFYAKTLRSLVLINEFTGSASYSFLLFRVDPLILLAWRCKHLSRIKIIGYEVSAETLIGISRLRGEKLKELKIPAVCISTFQLEENMKIGIEQALHHVQIEVQSSIRRPWRPLKFSELPLALRIDNIDPATVTLKDILRDQYWQ